MYLLDELDTLEFHFSTPNLTRFPFHSFTLDMSEGKPKTRYVFYRYIISVPAAATFVALFALSTVYHCYQLFRTRRWTMIPLIIGGLREYSVWVSDHNV